MSEEIISIKVASVEDNTSFEEVKTPDEIGSPEEVKLISVDINDVAVKLKLVDILKGFMGDENISKRLTTDQLYVTSILLNVMPGVFDKIEEHLSKIASDKVIDLNDLPEFVLLLTDILNVDAKSFKHFKITREDAINAIETIITILIEKDVIKTGDKQQESLEMIHICMKLIRTSVKLDKTISCWRCW